MSYPPTEMVKDDGYLRVRPRQIRQLRDLVVIAPGIKAEVILGQAGEPFPERAVQHHVFKRIGM